MGDLTASAPLFSVGFLLIFLWSAYTDIRYRRIKNSLLVIGILAACVLEIGVTTSLSVHRSFLFNTAIAIVIAVFLWRMNIWAAGDGKFFIFSTASVCALSTTEIISFKTGNIPIVFILLCNAFVVAFLYIFLESCLFFLAYAGRLLREGSMGDKIAAVRFRMKHPGFLLAQVKAFCFYAAALVFFRLAAGTLFANITILNQYPLFVFVMLLAFYPKIQRFLQKIKFLHLALGLILLIIWAQLDIISLFLRVAKLYAALGLVRVCINWFVRKKEYVLVPVSQLRPKMVVARVETAALADDRKPVMRFFSDGLTLEQAEYLKAYFYQTGKDKVMVYVTFPFVPFITLGVLFLYMSGGKPLDIISFLY